MIVLKNITKIYTQGKSEIRALSDLCLHILPGEYVAVKGPSGCGKTTLLLCTGGLLPPDKGTVLVRSENLYTLSPEQRARIRASKIGFVFQQFHLIPYLSVLENVLCAGFNREKKETEKRALELLERFQIVERRDHVPGRLSTGERQRTALARALINKPDILLADEPTGNLDEENASLVLRSLKEFAGSGGSVLLVTHDSKASETADRVIFLEKGRTKEESG